MARLPGPAGLPCGPPHSGPDSLRASLQPRAPPRQGPGEGPSFLSPRPVVPVPTHSLPAWGVRTSPCVGCAVALLLWLGELVVRGQAGRRGCLVPRTCVCVCVCLVRTRGPLKGLGGVSLRVGVPE